MNEGISPLSNVNSNTMANAKVVHVANNVGSMPKVKYVNVPNGWHRRTSNNAICYISPSGHVLLSKFDVKSYLEQKNTCKCYLRKQLRYEEVFNFDLSVLTRTEGDSNETKPSQCEEWAQSISEMIHCQMLLTLDHLVSIEVNDIKEVYQILTRSNNMGEKIPSYDEWLKAFEWDQIRVTKCGRKLLQDLSNDQLCHLTYELSISGELEKRKSEMLTVANSSEANKNRTDLNCDNSFNNVCYTANTPDRSPVKSPLVNSHQSPVRIYGNHVHNNTNQTIPSAMPAQANSYSPVNQHNITSNIGSVSPKSPARRRPSASSKANKVTTSPSLNLLPPQMTSIPPLIPVVSPVAQINSSPTGAKTTPQAHAILNPRAAPPATSPTKMPVGNSMKYLAVIQSPTGGLTQSPPFKVLNLLNIRDQRQLQNSPQLNNAIQQLLTKQPGKIVVTNQSAADLVQLNAPAGVSTSGIAPRQYTISKPKANELNAQSSNTNGQSTTATTAAPKRKRNTPSTRKKTQKAIQAEEDAATRESEQLLAAELKKQNLLAKTKLLSEVLDKPRLTKQEDSGNRTNANAVKLPRFESFKSALSDDPSSQTSSNPIRSNTFKYIHIVKPEQVFPTLDPPSLQQSQSAPVLEELPKAQKGENTHQLPEPPTNYIDYQLPQQEVHYAIDDSLSLPNANVLRLPLPQSPPPVEPMSRLSAQHGQTAEQFRQIGHQSIISSQAQPTTNLSNLNHVLVNDNYDPFVSQHNTSNNSIELSLSRSVHGESQSTEQQTGNELLPCSSGNDAFEEIEMLSSHVNLPDVPSCDSTSAFDNKQEKTFLVRHGNFVLSSLELNNNNSNVNRSGDLISSEVPFNKISNEQQHSLGTTTEGNSHTSLPEVVNDIVENIVENVENIQQEEEEIRLFSDVQTIFPEEESQLIQQPVNGNSAHSSSIIKPLTIPISNATEAVPSSLDQLYLDSNALIHSENGLFYFDSTHQSQAIPIQSLITGQPESGSHELPEAFEMIHIENTVQVSDTTLSAPQGVEDEEDEDEEDSKDNSKMTAEDIFKQITEFDLVKQKNSNKGKRKKKKITCSTPRKSPRKASTPVEFVQFNLPIEQKPIPEESVSPRPVAIAKQNTRKVQDSAIASIEEIKMDVDQVIEKERREDIVTTNTDVDNLVEDFAEDKLIQQDHQQNIELMNTSEPESLTEVQQSTFKSESPKNSLENNSENYSITQIVDKSNCIEPESDGDLSVEVIEVSLPEVEVVKPMERHEQIQTESGHLDDLSGLNVEIVEPDFDKPPTEPSVEVVEPEEQDEEIVELDGNDNEIKTASSSQHQQAQSMDEDIFFEHDSQVIEVIEPGMEMEDEETGTEEVIIIEPNTGSEELHCNLDLSGSSMHNSTLHTDDNDDPLLLLANVSMSQSAAQTSQTDKRHSKPSTEDSSPDKKKEGDDDTDTTGGENDEEEEEEEEGPTDEDDSVLFDCSANSTGNGSCNDQNNSDNNDRSHESDMNEEMKSRARYYKRMQRLKKELEFQGRPRKEDVDDVVDAATRLSPPKVVIQERVFKDGDIVWGKKDKFPNWPGRLVSAETCSEEEYEDKLNNKLKDDPKMVLVRWFGKCSRLQWISTDNLKNTSEGLDEHIRLNRRHRKTSSNRVVDRDLDDAIQDAFNEAIV